MKTKMIMFKDIHFANNIIIKYLCIKLIPLYNFIFILVIITSDLTLVITCIFKLRLIVTFLKALDMFICVHGYFLILYNLYKHK